MLLSLHSSAPGASLSGISAIAIASGVGHTCVIVTEGGVKCCGWNGYGQLGIGSTDDRNRHVDVPGAVKGSLLHRQLHLHLQQYITMPTHPPHVSPSLSLSLSLSHTHTHTHTHPITFFLTLSRSLSLSLNLFFSGCSSRSTPTAAKAHPQQQKHTHSSRSTPTAAEAHPQQQKHTAVPCSYLQFTTLNWLAQTRMIFLAQTIWK